MISSPKPFLRTLLLLLLGLAVCFPVLPARGASSLKTIIFTPVSPRPASPSEWKNFLDKKGISKSLPAGIDDKLSAALANFQEKPDMARAISVLSHYKTIAEHLSESQRQVLFDHAPRTFGSLMTAKYELALQTSRRLNQRPGNEIDHALRVGSSAQDLRKWLAWHRNSSEPPPLDAKINFKSDDDITHFPTRQSLAQDFMAAEKINGRNAAQVYIEISQEFGYSKGLDPELTMTEYLSPMENFLLLKRSGLIDTSLPGGLNALQAYIDSNPEKYSGLFADEFLRRAAEKKGYVITDVDQPAQSIKSYKDFVQTADGAARALPQFIQADDLHVWIASNHRMLFQVHRGDTHSLAKYTLRMIAGYDALGITPPEFKNHSLEKLRQAASAVYHPRPGSNPQAVIKSYGGLDRIKQDLRGYTRKLVLHSHELHLKRLPERYRAIAGSIPKGLSPEERAKALRQAAENDPELQKIKDNLALAYSNLSPGLKDELAKKTADFIESTLPGKQKKSSSDPETLMRAVIAKELGKCIDHADRKSANLRETTEAFRSMRENLGELLDQGMYKRNRTTLDTYLVDIAKGDFKGDFPDRELVWTGNGLEYRQRRKTAQEAYSDLQIIKGMGDFFGWDRDKLLDNTLAYLEGHPSEGFELIRRVHEVFGTPRPLQIKCENGNIVIVPPSYIQRGLSLGTLSFKAALKGYSIWGDLQNGKQLFNNLRSMYGTKSATLTHAQIEAMRAESLSLMIGLVETVNVFETFGRIRTIFKWPFPTDTLSTIASMSGGNIALDDAAARQLQLSLIKDLCSIAAPELAVFFTLYDIGTWGWDKYMLSRAEDRIVKLLVENGEWDFSQIGRKPANKAKPGQQSGHPELVRLCLSPQIAGLVPGASDFTVLNHCTSWLEGKDISKLARLPDTYFNYRADSYPGILCSKSKIFVHPRQELIEIAYRNNYISGNSAIGLLEKVPRDYFAQILKVIPEWNSLQDPRSWTEKSLEDKLGIIYPKTIREDLTKIPNRGDIKNIKVRKLPSFTRYPSSSYWGADINGPRTIDPNQLLSDNTRRVFALFVADYWCKRQNLLEGPILDAIITKASQIAYKEKQTQTDNLDDFYLNYLDLLRRAKLIDEKLWPRIADAAIPDYTARHQQQGTGNPSQNTAGRNRDDNGQSANDSKPNQTAANNKPGDKRHITLHELRNFAPGPDYPIARHFHLESRQNLDELIRCVEWLDLGNYDPDRKPFAVSTVEMVGNHPVNTTIYLDETQVKARAQKQIEILCDLLFKYEKTYDEITKAMDAANTYVSQGDGFSLLPKYHLRLAPGKGPAHDKQLCDEWKDGYTEALVQTERDVAQYLRDCKSKRGQSYLESLLRNWGNYYYDLNDEVAMAHSHPYWPYLLRLRFQIEKLKNARRVSDFINKKSFHENFSKTLKLRHETVKIPENLVYSASSSGTVRLTSAPPAIQTSGEGNTTPFQAESAPASAAAPPATGMLPPAVSVTPFFSNRKNHVRQWINELIKKMEEEYDQLIVGMDEMFAIKLEVKGCPVDRLQVLNCLQARALIRTKKNPASSLSSGQQSRTPGNAPPGETPGPADNNPAKPSANPPDNLFGPLTATERQKLELKIKSLVRCFRWRIYREDGSEIFSQEIKDEKDFSCSPEWFCLLTEAGHCFVELTLVGNGGNTLARKTFSIHVDKARLTGNLKIRGDWRNDGRAALPGIDFNIELCHPQPTTANAPDPAGGNPPPKCVVWGKTDLKQVVPPAGRDQVFKIEGEIDKVNLLPGIRKQMTENSNQIAYTRGEFRIAALWGSKTINTRIGNDHFSCTVRNNRSKTPGSGILEPGTLTIVESPVFVIFTPYIEEITATATDGAGKKTKAVFTFFQNSRPLGKSNAPEFTGRATATFPSRDIAAIRFRAEGERSTPFTVKASSPGVPFDPNQPTELSVRLPFYSAGGLTVRGRFACEPEPTPPLKIAAGTVTSNLGPETGVDPDGGFSFRNRIPWKQLAPIKIRALVWEDDNGRVFRPRGGEFTGGFKKIIDTAEIDLGRIPLEQQKVTVDPITVRVNDWNGDPLPAARLTVKIGGQPATGRNNDLFLGAWTFSKRHEKIKIKAELDMDYGSPVRGETELEITDKDFLAGKKELADPLELRLKVYRNLDILLENSIILPDNRQRKPTRISLTAIADGTPLPLDKNRVAADGSELVRLPTPVRVGTTLVIKARAQAGKHLFQGAASLKIPATLLNAALSLKITLAEKSAATGGNGSGVLQIRNLAVSGMGGRKMPVMGQGMVGNAEIVTGDIEAPQLALTWTRQSDGARKIAILNVRKNSIQNVSKEFAPVAKKLQTKFDRLHLMVSDELAPPQKATATCDFSWQEAGDEFVSLRAPLRALRGDDIELSSSWRISNYLGDKREIRYTANGMEFYRQPVSVVAGRRFHHRGVILKTGSLKAGRIRLNVTLNNADPPLEAKGGRNLKLEDENDLIVAATALAADHKSEALDTESGVSLVATVQAARDSDGPRTLTATFRGHSQKLTFELKGGQQTSQAFRLNTKGLRPSHYSARLKLFDQEGKLQDSRLVRFVIRKKPKDNGTGLRDVYCDSSVITIKFWDHAAQDGDIVTVIIGKRRITANLNACGGPKEPGGGGCVEANLHLGKGEIATVSVIAHNMGKYPPNTATLKIEGCNPVIQHWNLRTDGKGPNTGTITIHRSKAPLKRAKNPKRINR